MPKQQRLAIPLMSVDRLNLADAFSITPHHIGLFDPDRYHIDFGVPPPVNNDGYILMREGHMIFYDSGKFTSRLLAIQNLFGDCGQDLKPLFALLLVGRASDWWCNSLQSWERDHLMNENKPLTEMCSKLETQFPPLRMVPYNN